LQGAVDALIKIYRTEGLRGLYRGSGATFLRNVPASAIWWSTYELAKNWLHDFDLRERFPDFVFSSIACYSRLLRYRLIGGAD
jgi:hypothetical protein